jgi:hypothetical protein
MKLKKLTSAEIDLKKLAEIERDFSIFGHLTYEQQKQKTAILKKYE